MIMESRITHARGFERIKHPQLKAVYLCQRPCCKCAHRRPQRVASNDKLIVLAANLFQSRHCFFFHVLPSPEETIVNQTMWAIVLRWHDGRWEVNVRDSVVEIWRPS